MADDVPKIKNIVINKELKTYDNIAFLDMNEKIFLPSIVFYKSTNVNN